MKKMASGLMVALGACLLAAGTIGGCAQTQESTAPATSPVAFNFFAQEEPNTLPLNTHFSLLGIARIAGLTNYPPRTTIPTDGKAFPPENLERDVTVFHAGENIVIYGHVIAGTSLVAACFKAGESGYTKIDYWGPEGFSNAYLTHKPGEILVGYNPPDFILPTYLKLTPWQYRMKIFTGDTLVAVFSFEVIE